MMWLNLFYYGWSALAIYQGWITPFGWFLLGWSVSWDIRSFLEKNK